MAYTSKYTGEEIDAKLDEVKPVDIVDGLESDDSASALSARQGKVLKEMIEGGITEEKEVYIGEEEPTDDGAKLWIDPTGTPSSPSQPSAGVEVIDNLESDSATAALSANQGRVLKEMIEELPSEGVKLYPIYVPYFLETESLTTEQQQANADAVAAATNGDKIILELLLPDGTKAIVHSYSVMDGGLVLDLARSGVLNLSDYRAYVDMVILSTDGSVVYDSHDAFTLATKEYVDNAIYNVLNSSF